MTEDLAEVHGCQATVSTSIIPTTAIITTCVTISSSLPPELSQLLVYKCLMAEAQCFASSASKELSGLGLLRRIVSGLLRPNDSDGGGVVVVMMIIILLLILRAVAITSC